jgi:hypothetical protein
VAYELGAGTFYEPGAERDGVSIAGVAGMEWGGGVHARAMAVRRKDRYKKANVRPASQGVPIMLAVDSIAILVIL